MSDTNATISTAKEQAHKALRANLALVDKLTETQDFSRGALARASEALRGSIAAVYGLAEAADEIGSPTVDLMPVTRVA